jgi:hypothetical protein
MMWMLSKAASKDERNANAAQESAVEQRGKYRHLVEAD